RQPAPQARLARLCPDRGRARSLHPLRRRRLLHDPAPRPHLDPRRRPLRRRIGALPMNDISLARAARFIDVEARFGAKNYKPLDVVLTRGEGVYVWDVEGRRYLDCLSAYSAVNQGHCHPKILAAMVEQAGRLTLTSRAFRNDQLAPFYEELCALTHSHKALPMHPGAEAVETAPKIARKWAYQVKGVPDGQAEIIGCDGNFHG